MSEGKQTANLQPFQWKRVALHEGWAETETGLIHADLDREWPDKDWEAAARDTGAGDFEDDPQVIEFRKAASSASYHHADDTGKEWHLAKPYNDRCQEIFDNAVDEVKAWLLFVKGDYMISIRTDARS